MLKLDHLTVVAPSLAEGAAHVEACLGIAVPFGQRHAYMGTHNHLLQLGAAVYLEVVALDPEAEAPGRPRWFGLDDRERVRRDWNDGRRLRGWVARVDGIRAVVAGRRSVFGETVSLPPVEPSFDFAIPPDGSLPLDGAAPSIIDRRGRARSMAAIADRGARLHALSLATPDPAAVEALYRALAIDRPPTVRHGPEVRYRALIDTPAGRRELT